MTREPRSKPDAYDERGRRGQRRQRDGRASEVPNRESEREGRMGEERRSGRQIREKISVPLVPPNPKEFESAARMGIGRAVIGT